MTGAPTVELTGCLERALDHQVESLRVRMWKPSTEHTIQNVWCLQHQVKSENGELLSGMMTWIHSQWNVYKGSLKKIESVKKKVFFAVFACF